SPLDLDRRLEHVETGHRRIARRRRKKAGQHPHRGGFPCAIGAQKTYDLPLLHFKGDVVNGCIAGVPLRKLSNGNHWILVLRRRETRNRSCAAENFKFYTLDAAL